VAPLTRIASTVRRRSRSLQRQRLNQARAGGQKGSTPGGQDEDSEHGRFQETFVRSFLLGLGAGAILETLHVTSKFLGVIGQFAQAHQLAEMRDVLPSLSHQFSPLFAADHAVAITFWVLFYVMEAGAIMTILTQHGGDNKAAGKAISQLKTLPQVLLPSTFPLVKQLVKYARGFQPAVAGPSSRARAAPMLPVLPPMQPPNRSAFLDAGEAVLAPPAPPAVGMQEKIGGVGGPQSNVVPAPSRSSTKPQTEAAASPSAFAPSPPAEEVSPAPGQDVERRRERHTLPGELADPSTSDTQWAHRQRELLNRRLYLKDFWYAAALSQKVGKDPVGVEMLSEKIVLFRDDSGKVVAINDVCPHRGAPLHEGWVSNVDGRSCVVCPYHGWAFDAEGKVRDVPASENKGDWPKVPVVSAYDVVEKGGFVWLFNGSKAMPVDARPPIPYVPELDDPKWKPVYGEIEFECGHWAVFENAIDMAHIHYLHSDSFGNKDAPSIREMEAKNGPYAVSATFSLTNKPVNAMWEWSKVKEVQVTARAMLPSTSVISFTLGNGLSFTTFVNTVPINEGRTVNRFALIRNLEAPLVPGVTGKLFNMDAWDKLAHDAMIKILSEDKAMVEQLRPDLLQREVNVKADGVQTAFRRLRQDYINLGYGVLPHSGHH
jgi:phenylpropionate dioxygenase-like ring-hydroxylating dioxygenase large terminal subunit